MRELSPYFLNRSTPEVNANFSTSAKAFDQDEPNFREYCRIIRKRWRLIVTLVICALALTGLVVFLIPPTYTATSTILIEPRAPQVLGITELETEASGEVAEQGDYYGTEYKILQSRSLAARVIRKLHLQNEPFLGARETKAMEIKFLAQKALSKGSITDEDQGAGTLGIGSDVIDAYLKHLRVQSDPGRVLSRSLLEHQTHFCPLASLMRTSKPISLAGQNFTRRLARVPSSTCIHNLPSCKRRSKNRKPH